MVKLAECVNRAYEAGKGGNLHKHHRKIRQIIADQEAQVGLLFQYIFKVGEQVDNDIEEEKNKDAGEEYADYGFQDVAV